jgi:elongation factor P
MQFSYRDGDDWVFMDTSNYELITIADKTVGESGGFMLENQQVMVAFHQGNALYLELPASVSLKIEYTEPGLQGDRATGGTKKAKMETGIEVDVPLFIEQGEVIKVDTRDRSYLGRA